jgi:hypothetical protein
MDTIANDAGIDGLDGNKYSRVSNSKGRDDSSSGVDQNRQDDLHSDYTTGPALVQRIAFSAHE